MLKAVKNIKSIVHTLYFTPQAISGYTTFFFLKLFAPHSFNAVSTVLLPCVFNRQQHCKKIGHKTFAFQFHSRDSPFAYSYIYLLSVHKNKGFFLVTLPFPNALTGHIICYT